MKFKVGDIVWFNPARDKCPDDPLAPSPGRGCHYFKRGSRGRVVKIRRERNDSQFRIHVKFDDPPVTEDWGEWPDGYPCEKDALVLQDPFAHLLPPVNELEDLIL